MDQIVIPRESHDAHYRLRVVPLYQIAEGAATYLTEQLGKLALDSPKDDINILFRSPGGFMVESLACIDSINMARGLLEDGAKIRGLVQGAAFSAASFLLQFCDHRAMTAHSQIMIHGWSGGSQGDARAIKASKVHTDAMHKVYAEAYLARTGYKNFKYWNDMMSDETPLYLTADKAKAMGLIDEIVPVYLPGRIEAQEAS